MAEDNADVWNESLKEYYSDSSPESRDRGRDIEDDISDSDGVGECEKTSKDIDIEEPKGSTRTNKPAITSNILLSEDKRWTRQGAREMEKTEGVDVLQITIQSLTTALETVKSMTQSMERVSANNLETERKKRNAKEKRKAAKADE
ncbi:hypothetical protein QAD02_022661 [Eretmocerus hayati]|uniref:Uncharacterized protein n=1 Tax=Eretmocerus hayati TaxID=131215 RepID=A0ACC2PTX9_9HYME|nr:hypothetical protein QAD02_022661 [Eretmocerus hayati]